MALVVDEVFRYLPMSGKPHVWLAHVLDHVFEALEPHAFARALWMLCGRIYTAWKLSYMKSKCPNHTSFTFSGQWGLTVPAIVRV